MTFFFPGGCFKSAFHTSFFLLAMIFKEDPDKCHSETLSPRVKTTQNTMDHARSERKTHLHDFVTEVVGKSSVTIGQLSYLTKDSIQLSVEDFNNDSHVSAKIKRAHQLYLKQPEFVCKKGGKEKQLFTKRI